MWLRLLCCLALALAAIALTQAQGADDSIKAEPRQQPYRPLPEEFNFSDRKSVPRPPEVIGWILVRVCSVTGKLDHRFTEWAYIRPSFVIGIGNPPTSPDPCVALHSVAGKRLFVEGSMQAMARYIMDAEDDGL